MSPSEIRSFIEKIQSLVDDHKWSRLGEEPINIELVSFDLTKRLPVDAIFNALEYIQMNIGIRLQIVGGGYSCSEIGLHFSDEDISSFAQAIESDEELGRRLNEAKFDLIRLRSPQGLSNYAAYYKMQIGICTNRSMQYGRVSDVGVVGQFGDVEDQDGKLYFGVAEILILDRSDNQTEENFISRVWRRVISQGDFTSSDDKVRINNIDIIDDIKVFKHYICNAIAKGFATFLHGFANSFDDAVFTAGLLAHKAQFRKLETFPLLFSWPSKGNIKKYLQDTNAGENSGQHLATFLEFVDQCRNRRPHSIIAHSHGSKVLIGALLQLSVRKSEMAPITRVLFVASDVDSKYFIDSSDILAKWTTSQVLYYSKKDRALLLSGIAFESNRLGKVGLSKDDISKLRSMDVIDVTEVSRGLTHHAHHIESAEVLDDIHQCLMGLAAKERLRLEQERGQQHYWKVR